MTTNYQRAKTVVKQINNGEWVANPLSTGEVLTISKNDVQIWVGNTSFDCGVYVSSLESIDLFGYFWRHWVWWSAQKLRKGKRKPKESVNSVFSRINHP